MKQISKHITYKEATYSPTAIKRGITNSPDDVQLENMQMVANDCFEPAREYFKKPIYINSFFRSMALNSRIGGSSSSQHCADNGAAIDLDTKDQEGFSNADLFFWLKDNVDFDQLIWEFGTDSEPAWVHISKVKTGNRKQVLKAKRIDGLTKYIIF